jgi:dCTP deaminase
VALIPPLAGVLSQDEIVRLIVDGDLIEPRPSLMDVGNGTIDLRLSDVILTGKRSSVSAVVAHEPAEGRRLFHEVRVRNDSRATIQPHQFVLGSTLEYLSLPINVAGVIQSRSSIGRMGIVAVAAAWVGPGFKGCPTLEITNLGDVAVEIQPFREAICQVVLLHAGGGAAQLSRYQCLTKPTFALPPYEELARRFSG